ncbi:hypothetical protein TWF694_010367 [Orbilia ellipsospora]|uniref:Hypervirulence associated protein TUDOR domain-containing protein n=1 Tax=Orbilia ellipsospora TaxID=2528407 RepID=A0AAV9XA05_9PEZI
MTDLQPGDRAQWNWGQGHPTGTVSEIKDHGSISIQSAKGNIVTRNAEPSNPAVQLDHDGTDVVKRASELEKIFDAHAAVQRENHDNQQQQQQSKNDAEINSAGDDINVDAKSDMDKGSEKHHEQHDDHANGSHHLQSHVPEPQQKQQQDQSEHHEQKHEGAPEQPQERNHTHHAAQQSESTPPQISKPSETDKPQEHEEPEATKAQEDKDVTMTTQDENNQPQEIHPEAQPTLIHEDEMDTREDVKEASPAKQSMHEPSVGDKRGREEDQEQAPTQTEATEKEKPEKETPAAVPEPEAKKPRVEPEKHEQQPPTEKEEPHPTAPEPHPTDTQPETHPREEVAEKPVENLEQAEPPKKKAGRGKKEKEAVPVERRASIASRTRSKAAAEDISV